MMSGEDIHALARQVAIKAAAYGVEPYAPINPEECKGWKRFPFPGIGHYRPEGWTLVEYVQADKGGEYDGFSLGAEQLKAWCYERTKLAHQENCRAGFAIIEEGEFQLVIGYFSDDPQAVSLLDDERENYTWQDCPNCDEPVETDTGGDFKYKYCPWCRHELDPEPLPFEVGDLVDVDEPGLDDLWQHGFQGRVDEVDEDNETICVIDGDGDAWDVDYTQAKLAYDPALDPAQLQLAI